MALIFINPDVSFAYFSEKINQELSLQVKILFKGTDYAKSSQEICKFWKNNKESFKVQLAQKYQNHDLLPLFDYLTPIRDLKRKLTDIFGFDFEFYYEGSLASENYAISSFIKIKEKENTLLKLDQLNKSFRVLLENLKKEISETKEYYKTKIEGKNSIYETDFEIEISITFHLNEKDKLYNDECDNIMFSYDMSTHMNDQEFDEYYLYREFQTFNKQLQEVKDPCYLLYWLSENLTVPDILRIGILWCDFNFINQKFLTI